MAQDTKTTQPPSTTTEVVEEKTPAAVHAKATDIETEKDVKEMTTSTSFKEESNVIAELNDAHKKALDEFKQLVQDALNKHEFYAPETPVPEPVSSEEPEEVKKEEPAAAVEQVVTTVDDGAKTVEAIDESVVAVASKEPAPKEPELEEQVPVQEQAPAPELAPEEVSIYGIPLLADERSDTILLKFLRARDFKVKDAFSMIKNTVRWRREFGVDGLVDEDLGNDWDKVMFVDGSDKEGHPVCYNVYGEFMDKELYQKTFGDEEKRNKFIKWVIQSLEKSVRKLDFGPTGISSIVQVNDLTNSPGLLKRELRQTTDKALQLLQDNYPEFVAKQVFINVPWWYLAFYTVISPFLTQRSKSKFVIASPAKTAETLFKYIAPEQVPLQYGGLTGQGKQEFSAADNVSEVTVKASSKETVEFPVTEKCHFVWELRVIGWDVSYGAEFVPEAKDGYTVIVQKSRKITSPDEPVIFNGYKVCEPGKIVVTIDNTSSKKKKLLYRSKIIPLSD